MSAEAAPLDLPEHLPEPGVERARLVDAQLQRARTAHAEGDLTGAREILDAALRAGLWRHTRLWTELLSLMETPADYSQIRALWLASASSCQRTIAVLRTVARAASAAGEHDDARLLLRKAILQQSGLRKRVRARLRPVKRRVTASLPGRRPDQADFATRAAAALTDLDHDLNPLGVRAFLISGTLLGYVREGGFIGWDKDIDLGFFTEELPPTKLEQAFRRSSRFTVRRLDFNADRLRVNHSNGMMIDIFPHYQGEDGRVWHDGTATRWWNTPFELTTVEFLGRAQYVPDPPERYLEENYGDWRTPQPDFDARFDTPNVEVTDPEYFDTLLYFSLLDAVGNGNVRKRRRYAELLTQRGETGWLERVGHHPGEAD